MDIDSNKILLCVSCVNPKPFVGYEEHVKTLSNVIKNTIVKGESSTALVYGGRGMGKTSLVNHCLAKEECVSHCKLIRLNGLIHGNDTSTVRHIGRCLGLPGSDFLQIVTQFQEELGEEGKANLIFVIDEFDVFCKKNQLLLYNFFDLIQHVRHVFVIGITTRFDCVELLEKRVKSRMNSIIIKLTIPYKTLGEYLEFATKLTNGQLVINEQEQKQLEILYSRTYSVRELKMCIARILIAQEISLEMIDTRKPRPIQTIADHKVRYLGSLSDLELSILLLCYKLVYKKGLEKFNCGTLFTMLHELPTQISANKRLAYTVIGNLLDYGILVVENSGSQAKSTLHLTEWTTLILNITEEQVRTGIDLLGSSLNVNIKKLCDIQR